jgi:chromosome segregation ATPase
LQLANEFLTGDKHTKTKTIRTKHKAEENLKAITEAAAQYETKKNALENAKDHLARDYELTKQDLKLAEKEARRAREEKQKLSNEREKLRLAMDAIAEDDRAKPQGARTTSNGSEVYNRILEEESDATSTIDQLGRETEKINTKAEALRREAAKLAEDRAAMQFEQTQAKIARESDKLALAQDLKGLKKMQDHRAELKARLEGIQQSLAGLGANDPSRPNLIIEQDFVKKRVDEVEKLIRDEIKQL